MYFEHGYPRIGGDHESVLSIFVRAVKVIFVSVGYPNFLGHFS